MELLSFVLVLEEVGARNGSTTSPSSRGAPRDHSKHSSTHTTAIWIANQNARNNLCFRDRCYMCLAICGRPRFSRCTTEL
uniref:Putative secreted protein n=1 Tax=Anopheles darlingi TaxID=43151 RepID=A0A2M4DKF2_ANODA